MIFPQGSYSIPEVYYLNEDVNLSCMAKAAFSNLQISRLLKFPKQWYSRKKGMQVRKDVWKQQQT